MDKKVYTYTQDGNYAGYVKVVNGQNGEIIGEIYNQNPDGRIGAVHLAPVTIPNMEAWIYNEEGAQVGIARFENMADGLLVSDIYSYKLDGSEESRVAHIHYDPNGSEEAEVQRVANWGQEMGTLKPYNVSSEEMMLFGGAAAYLLLF